MKTIRLSRAAFLGVIFALLCSPVLGHAQQVNQTTAPVRFLGQVTALLGPSTSPTGLTLQLKDGESVQIRVAPRTTIRARSAEAEVEGLEVGDYALATAHRSKNFWLASRIDYDIQPFEVPREAVVSGTVVRVAPTGLRFFMKLDTGEVRPVSITRKTKYRVDGQPVDSAPLLAKGMFVQVSMVRPDRVWFAVDINVKSSGAPPRI